MSARADAALAKLRELRNHIAAVEFQGRKLGNRVVMPGEKIGDPVQVVFSFASPNHDSYGGQAQWVELDIAIVVPLGDQMFPNLLALAIDVGEAIGETDAGVVDSQPGTWSQTGVQPLPAHIITVQVPL